MGDLRHLWVTHNRLTIVDNLATRRPPCQEKSVFPATKLAGKYMLFFVKPNLQGPNRIYRKQEAEEAVSVRKDWTGSVIIRKT